MASSVLYVDDDRNLCQIVAKALVGEGYSVRTCHDGEEALAVLREAPPDLLLLDLMLPRRDGFEVLGEIRASSSPLADLPVVLLSGASTTPAYAARANELRALDLLAKPVPLEDLLDVVGRTVSHTKRPRAARTSSSAPAQRRGASGNFERISFPAVLHHLHGMRASGVLHMVVAKKRKWLQLRDGYPVGIRSNLLRETLGQQLLKSRRIDRSMLEDSRRIAKQRKMRQGEALVAMDILSEEQVSVALREQADEKFFEIFSWTSGSFRFERGATLERANALGLGRSPATLIFEGVSTRFPLERIDRYLKGHSAKFLGPAENPFYRFQDLPLDGEDGDFLRGIDGTRTVGELARCEEGTRRAIYALLAAGLLEFRDEAGQGAAGKPATSTGGAPASAGGRLEERVTPATRAPDRRADDPRHAELMRLADRLQSESPDQVFGVSPDADEAEVKQAWESLSAEAHPDRFQDGSQALRSLARDVFAQLRDAYDQLTDPRQRQLADWERQKRERERERADAEREVHERAFQAVVQAREGEEALKARAYEKALLHFGKALELYPEEGDYHADYGYALHLCNPEDTTMVAEAMEHVRRGLKIASHREKPYLYCGRLLKAVGRAEDAEKMFLRAVQLEPECVEAIRELRLIQMRREKSKGFLSKLFRR